MVFAIEDWGWALALILALVLMTSSKSNAGGFSAVSLGRSAVLAGFVMLTILSVVWLEWPISPLEINFSRATSLFILTACLAICGALKFYRVKLSPGFVRVLDQKSLPVYRTVGLVWLLLSSGGIVVIQVATAAAWCSWYAGPDPQWGAFVEMPSLFELVAKQVFILICARLLWPYWRYQLRGSRLQAPSMSGTSRVERGTEEISESPILKDR